MSGFFDAVKEEITSTIRRPSRLRHAVHPRRLVGYLGYLWWRLKLPDRWQATGTFERRSYTDYRTYVQHQSQKLASLDLDEYDRTYAGVLASRIEDMDLHGKSVLCLAARIGTEVKAFRAKGAFAVGIDLNPGPRNQFVTFGDFHRLPFSDRCVALVFTNSLDHAFDIDELLDEVHRVLVPNGSFVVDAVLGLKEGKAPQFYESFYWDSIDGLIGRIESHRFVFRSRLPFTEPWRGEHLRFGVSG